MNTEKEKTIAFGLEWSKEKIKANSFDWFQQVVKGYVDNGKMAKPTDAALRKEWEKITEQKTKTE